ncbi:Uncharacterised protein [Vibrio cholerae]|nr:Uncharacterised protein [Vibrio cholerae]
MAKLIERQSKADHGIVVVLFKLLFLAHLHASNV